MSRLFLHFFFVSSAVSLHDWPVSKFWQEILRLIEPFRASWKGTLYGAAGMALMLVYFYQGSAGFFARHLSSRLLPGTELEVVQWWGTLYQFGCAFVLLFLVPAFFLKFVGKEKLTGLGLGLGEWKAGILVTVLGILAISLPFGLTAGSMPDFRAVYPLSKLAASSGGRFLVYQLCYGLLFYIAWEAFFRGFLQIGLRRHIGDLGAILVQTSASTLLHIGKPLGEVWAALAAGFVFGLVIVRVRSIWPLVIVHWGLGLVTDISCAHASGIW